MLSFCYFPETLGSDDLVSLKQGRYAAGKEINYLESYVFSHNSEIT